MDTFTAVAGRPALPQALSVPAALPTGSNAVRVASTAGCTTTSGSAHIAPLCVAAVGWTLGVFARRCRSGRHRHRQQSNRSRQLKCRWPLRPKVAASAAEADVVVIGSGLGGLTCAGVLAAAGKSVIVLESHYKAGGAAHTFAAKAKGVDGKFYFDSGPSLYGGLSETESSSPVKHVFQIIGEEPEWIKYDRWNAFIPEGEANAAIGYEEFVSKILPEFGGPSAKEQWDRLMRQLMPLAEAVVNGPPPSAVREDLGALLTLGRYAGKLKAVPGGPQKLSEPFSDFLSNAGVTDPFIRNWMDMFAFLLQGLPSYGAPTSMMAYMMADLYRKNTCLDFPKGGNEAMVDALVRGVEKHEGCQVMLKSHVEELLVKGGRAAGVRLRGGEIVLAREAVVSNADYRVTKGLVPDGSAPELEKYLDESWQKFPQLRSFIHIHLGFKGDGLPSQHCPEFPAQWGVFNDWTDLEAKRNAVLVSCPSMLDPELAPPGYHALHAYTPVLQSQLNMVEALWEAHVLNAAALGVGIVKCGLTGLAPATSYAFAVNAPLGAKGGLGLMQPVLVAGDAAAIWAHGGIPSREDLSLISGLLLHTLIGLAAGYALLDIVSDSLVKRLLGAAILVTFLRRCANYLKVPGFGHGGQAGTKGQSWHSSVVTAALGAGCGMVSVLTNNSGLLLDAYLIGLKLPKQRFLSMRSSYLLVAGVMKLVGHLGFGVLPLAALPHATWLCLLAIVGVLVGKQLVKLIPQVAFDLVVSSFVLCGALRLVVRG